MIEDTVINKQDHIFSRFKLFDVSNRQILMNEYQDDQKQGKWEDFSSTKYISN